ncbi:hypothetical protein O3M35_002703 [Rhynocoris fuscipes]|uniref:Reverse transcriptase zinc-binding domain-containing protein n=1 Tax=Rhynocoris fuscipes TaxID=488301 RepID=A0AAW1CL80_9HEMI
MENNDLSFNSKLTVFHSVSRSILCYGAQIWGGVVHLEVEKLFRFAIKKLFRLPNYTSTTFIHLETKIAPMFIFTLKLHHDYIIKVLSLPDNLIMGMLALHTIRNKLFWFKDIIDLINKYSLNVDSCIHNLDKWPDILKNIRRHLTVKMTEEFTVEISKSKLNLGKELSFELGESHNLYSDMKLYKIRWLMKSRGEEINLNYKFYKTIDLNCSLCNTEEPEDIVHFLAKCTSLSHFWLRFFHKATLDFVIPKSLQWLYGKIGSQFGPLSNSFNFQTLT